MAEKSFSVRLSANISAYKAAMNEASKATDQFAGRSQAQLEATGRKMQDVGGRMTSKLTLPLIAAGGAAAKMFGDFDSAMTKIVSLVGLSADEVDGMRDSVLGLAGETAKSPRELAEALFVVTSAGLRGSDAMDALESAAKASAAGLGQTNDIARAVAGTLNAYGPGVLSAADATDILTATARAGNFETSQLAGSLGRVLPFAKQAGASFADVGGAVALMTRTNGDAAQSITNTTSLLKSFVVPTQEAVTQLARFGMTAQDVRDSIAQDGLVATLGMLDEKLGGNREALGRILGSAEGATAAFTILDATAQDVSDTFGVTADAVGMTNDAFATTSETASFEVKQAWANIQVALIEAGAVILPVIAGVAGSVANLASVFTDLPQAGQFAVLAFLAVVAAAGPAVKAIGTLLVNIGRIKAAMVLLKAAMLAHPVLAFGAAVVAVGGAMFLAADRGRSMRGAVDDMADAMNQAGDASVGFVDRLNGIVLESDTFARALDAAGVTTLDLAKAVEAGGATFDAMRAQIMSAAEAAGVEKFELAGLAGSLNNLDGIRRDGIAQVERQSRVMSDATEASADHGVQLGRQAESARLSGLAASLLGDNLDDLAASQELSADEAEAAAKAQQGFIDTVLKGVSAVFDYELSLLSLDDALGRYASAEADANDVLMDSTKSTGEKDAAVRRLRQEEIALAGQVLRTAQAFATEQGAADGSTRSAQLQIDALGRMAQRYPGLRDEIGSYVAELMRVPGTVNTALHVNAGQAFRDMDEVERRLFRLAQTSVYVPVRVGGAGASGNVRYMADGGIVDRATPAVVGEAGREVVLPLTNSSRMSELVNDPAVLPAIVAAMSPASAGSMVSASSAGGGGTVFAPTVNVTAGMGADAEDIGRVVIAAVNREYAQGGPRIRGE